MPTGSRRDLDEGKPRPDLISPFLKLRLGNQLGLGAVKYGEHNWSKGQSSARARASLERHLMEADMGLEEEDHLSAALFNIMIMVHNQEMKKLGILPAGLDNWPVRWGLQMRGGDPNFDAPPIPGREELEAAAKACGEYMEELRAKIRAQIVEELTEHGIDTDERGNAD
jgi:hypothetical protein